MAEGEAVAELPVHIDVEASLATFAAREHIQRINGQKLMKLHPDLERYAAIIDGTKPDVVIETGSRFGGSALWFAERGLDVISIDLDRGTSRPEHPRVTWVWGDSSHPGLAEAVARMVAGRRVMVSLDSDHTAPHVAVEIRLYGPLVTPGCYLVVEDSIFEFAPPAQLRKLALADLIERGSPMRAIEAELAGNPDWVRDEDIERLHPKSHHPAGWWRRV